MVPHLLQTKTTQKGDQRGITFAPAFHPLDGWQTL